MNSLLRALCLSFIGNLTLLSSLGGQESSDSAMLLKFGGTDWSVPKTVILYGVDDDIEDGDQPYTVTVGPSESNDSTYDGLSQKDVSVINVDDEVVGEKSRKSLTSDSRSDDTVSAQAEEGHAILLSGITGLATSEEGNSATFTVRLASEPAADVTVPLRISDGSEGSFLPRADSSNLKIHLGKWRERVTGWVADNRGGLLVGAVVGGSVAAWVFLGSEKETVIQPPPFPRVP